MKSLMMVFGCCLFAVGCATTRYEEFGPPPTEMLARQAIADSLPALQEKIKVMEVRISQLEAELGGRFSGLETALGELATRMMSLSEQVNAMSRQTAEVPGSASPSTPQPAPVQDVPRLYEQALGRYYDRQYEEAQRLFHRVLDADPRGNWAGNAQYWIGECEYGKKNYQAALDAFHKVFQYAKTAKDDDAQFMIGQCYYHLGNLDNALVEFNRLKIDYPDSEYIGRAEGYIRKIRAAQSISQ